MIIKQVSVFLENRQGRLAFVTGLLAEKHINLRALSIADTTSFGILRLIADKPEEVKAVLAEKNVAFTYDDAAVALLVDKGYSEKYGARHLRRLIQTDVEDAVASVIIEGYQNAVTAVSLTVENGALKLESH